MLRGIYMVALAWLVIVPLDAARFHWSPAFPLWLKAVGGLLLLPALYLIQRATMENTYLSTLVRIQDDRGQRVISTGVYGLVRHPLYFGCLLMMIGGPLLVGSVAGLLITALGTVGLVARILGEEQMLRTELKGYAEYSGRCPTGSFCTSGEFTSEAPCGGRIRHHRPALARSRSTMSLFVSC